MTESCCTLKALLKTPVFHAHTRLGRSFCRVTNALAYRFPLIVRLYGVAKQSSFCHYKSQFLRGIDRTDSNHRLNYGVAPRLLIENHMTDRHLVYSMLKEAVKGVLTKYCVDQMPVGQMPVGQMSVGQMSLGQLSVGQMSVGQMSLGQMSLGQMSLGQMSLGQMSLGQMSLG